MLIRRKGGEAMLIRCLVATTAATAAGTSTSTGTSTAANRYTSENLFVIATDITPGSLPFRCLVAARTPGSVAFRCLVAARTPGSVPFRCLVAARPLSGTTADAASSKSSSHLSIHHVPLLRRCWRVSVRDWVVIIRTSAYNQCVGVTAVT